MHILATLLLATALQVTEPVWNDAPPTMPKGTKIAVLEGDTKAEGMFTVRLKVPAGSTLAPHTHPRPERVTVLSGRVRVGFGKSADASGTTFATGGFYVNPPGEPHFVVFEEETVLQLTCEGPWLLELVK